jgi:hypothetical protein
MLVILLIFLLVGAIYAVFNQVPVSNPVEPVEPHMHP